MTDHVLSPEEENDIWSDWGKILKTKKPAASKKLQKFSQYLMSPVIILVVGPESDRQNFSAHQGLLEMESEMIRTTLRVGMSETAKGSIDFPEQDPSLFGYFLEYIYRDGWLYSQETIKAEDYVTLARLHALGAFLGADNFMEVITQKFTRRFLQATVNVGVLCELLEVACLDLQERPAGSREGLIRTNIFYSVANRMFDLRSNDQFHGLLDRLDHKKLARQLLMVDTRKTPEGNVPIGLRASRAFQPESPATPAAEPTPPLSPPPDVLSSKKTKKSKKKEAEEVIF